MLGSNDDTWTIAAHLAEQIADKQRYAEANMRMEAEHAASQAVMNQFLFEQAHPELKRQATGVAGRESTGGGGGGEPVNTKSETLLQSDGTYLNNPNFGGVYSSPSTPFAPVSTPSVTPTSPASPNLGDFGLQKPFISVNAPAPSPQDTGDFGLSKPFISSNVPSQSNDSAFGTFYTPYGSQTQLELLNTRTLIDQKSGELGFYQVPMDPNTGLPRTGVYGAEAGGMLIGGGGRNAAQSGMFNQGVSGTPDIRNQWNPAQYAETANVMKANAIRANPELYSRLGAEAYNGQVALLDGRTLSPDTPMARYPDWTGNLANLAVQAAPSKADYAGANIPWSIPINSPYLSYMDTRGLQGAAPNAYNPTASLGYTGELYGVGSRVGKTSNPTPEPTTFIVDKTGGRYGLASEFFGEKYVPVDIYKSYGWGDIPVHTAGETKVNVVLPGAATLKSLPMAATSPFNIELPGGAGLGFGVQAGDKGTNVGVGYRDGTSLPGDVTSIKSPIVGSEYFKQTSNAIQNLPVLGFFYDLGAGVNKNTVSGINDFVRNTPILDNIVLGGSVFGAKKEYDYQGDKLSKSDYSTQLSEYDRAGASYTANVTAFSPVLATFNADVATYEKNKDTMPFADAQSQYSQLTSRESSINARQSELASEYSVLMDREGALKAQTAPFETAATNYKDAAAGLVGGGRNDATAIYPIAAPFMAIGEGYSNVITKPFGTFLSPLDSNPVTGALKSGALGFVGVPGALFETVGQSLVGGERTVKNLQNLPALAVSGGAMTAEGFVSDPVRFTAGLVGTYAMFSLGGTALTKGTGYVRTIGKEYIPIEQLGYDANAGFPVSPRGMTVGQLRTSFETNTLIPAPVRMSTGEVAPYNPANTALPGETAGSTYLWSGWDTSPNMMALKQGSRTAYELGRGTSELPGMYGAPVLEAYFTKTGSQTPSALGIGSPIKLPTAVRTELIGLDNIPSGLSRSADYAAIDTYAQNNVAGGRAFMPMTKIEYEAVLQQGNVMDIGASNYYTKVGGIGASRWFGTRIPIVDQTATGRIIPRSTTPQTNVVEDYSYKPDAYVGGYSLAGSLALTKVYPGSLSSTPHQKSSVVAIDREPYYSSTPVSSKPLFSSSSEPISSTTTRASSIVRDYQVSRSSELSYPTLPYKSISSPLSNPSGISTLGYTKPYSSIVTPPYSPPPSRPYSPTKTPPTHIPPLFPLFPGMPGLGGGGPTTFGKKKPARFTKTTWIGLDRSVTSGFKNAPMPKGFAPTGSPRQNHKMMTQQRGTPMPNMAMGGMPPQMRGRGRKKKQPWDLVF